MLNLYSFYFISELINSEYEFRLPFHKAPKFIIDYTSNQGERRLKELKVIEKSENDSLVGTIILEQGLSSDIKFFILDKETKTESERFYINKKGEIRVKDGSSFIYDAKSYYMTMYHYVYATNKYGSNKEYSYLKTSKWFDDKTIEHKNGVKVAIRITNLPEKLPKLGDTQDNVETFINNKSSIFYLSDLVLDKGDTKILKYEIVSGNENSIFKIDKNFDDYILKINKTDFTYIGEHTLEIQASNKKGLSNIAKITILINNLKAPTLRNHTHKINTKGQRIVRLDDSSFGVNIVKSLNGVEYDDLIFELEEDSLNYEIKSYNNFGTNTYAIYLKDGKQAVSETLKVKVKTNSNYNNLESNTIEFKLTK